MDNLRNPKSKIISNNIFYKIPIKKKSNSLGGLKGNNRVYYSHLKNRNIIKNNDNFKNNKFDNLSLINNSYNINKNKNEIKRTYDNNSHYLNKNYYIPHTHKTKTKQFEESFGYSNYLLDNLQDRISKITFL